MADEGTVIHIGAHRSVSVQGLGLCQIHGASMGLEMLLAEYYDHPFRVNYRAFVDELLAGCIEQPEMTPAEVSQLSEPVRARLRALVAEESDCAQAFRALRGAHLSADERLFAATMWHYEEWTARMGEFVLGFGVAVNQEVGRFAGEVLKPAVDAWRRQSQQILAPLQENLRGILDGSSLVKRLLGDTSTLRLQALGLQRPSWAKELSNTNRLFSPPPNDVLRRLSVPQPPPRLGQAPLSPALRNIVSPATSSTIQQLMDVFPGLAEANKGLRDFLDFWSEQAQERAALNSFARTWENSSYWFVLSLLSVRSSRSLFTLSRAELEEAMLDALESAARDSSFIKEMQDAVERCALLERSQKRHLVHGLDHAREGAWLDCCPPLLNGLEGAFWVAARAHNVINEERYRLDKPKVRVDGVEGLFKHLPVTPHYVTFLRHKVFGGTGNPFRHGDAKEGERRQALFAIAALAGWLDEFADAPARHALGTRIQLHLVQTPPLKQLPAA